MGDESWHRWMRRRRLVTEATIATHECSIRRMERHFGIHRDALTLDHALDFMGNGYAPATKQVTWVAFKLRHRWGAIAGKWPLDPEIFEIRIPKKRQRVKPALSVEQARTFLALAVTPSQQRVAGLGLLAGLRLHEMVAVDRDSWQSGIISIIGKGDWPRDIPVHRLLAPWRATILADHPTRRSLQDACIRTRPILGVDFSPQWLRRTFSQRLRSLGIEPSVRGALMGHAPGSVMDEFYSPPTWLEMVEAMDRHTY